MRDPQTPIRLVARSGDALEPNPSDQLVPFIPRDREARQLNHGQGEGQIQVQRTVWGVYVDPVTRGYRLQFEEGHLTPEQFSSILESIRVAAEDYFRQPIAVSISGCWNEELAGSKC